MKLILSLIICISLFSVCFADSGLSDKDIQLIKAAERGNIMDIRNAISNGADVNARRASDGVTALWLVTGLGEMNIFKLLLERGADVNVKSKTNGVTPLWRAADMNLIDAAKLLLDKGADISIKRKNVSRGNCSVVSIRAR